MEMLILIAIAVILAVANYFLSSAILLWVCKIFKVEKATFRSSLLIILLLIVLGLLAGLLIMLLVSIIGIQIIGQLLSLIAGLVIFHFLLKKFYQTKFWKNVAIYVVLDIFIAIFSLAMIIPIRYFVVQPFYNVGEAMLPTFVDHDYLLIKMYDKNFQRGDVVIFRYPKDLSQYFIKRIVGLPGEKVSFADGRILINGQVLDESQYLGTNITTPSLEAPEYILAAGEYFVLGDNRSASLDSRRFGPISKSLIIGKYWFTGLKSAR
ncbi:MAG: signal peptidase I [Candidatus Parcubacteria bacterium]|nr:signal peptidase I [Candidatus Parcubacteria bacterium]